MRIKLRPTIFVLFCTICCCTSHKDLALVDVQFLDPTIIVDLRYATDQNFVGKVLYHDGHAILRRITAERLVRVQHRLRRKGLGLKIWDAYRPLSVQKEMWALVPDTRYVADPRRGSRHNRGAAVDVTLVDARGTELEMPTVFDAFSDSAAADFALLSEKVIANRRILQEAMTSEGFLVLESEWWHFDDPEWRKCEILDLPIQDILHENSLSKREGAK